MNVEKKANREAYKVVIYEIHVKPGAIMLASTLYLSKQPSEQVHAWLEVRRSLFRAKKPVSNEFISSTMSLK